MAKISITLNDDDIIIRIFGEFVSRSSTYKATSYNDHPLLVLGLCLADLVEIEGRIYLFEVRLGEGVRIRSEVIGILIGELEINLTIGKVTKGGGDGEVKKFFHRTRRDR